MAMGPGYSRPITLDIGNLFIKKIMGPYDGRYFQRRTPKYGVWVEW